MATYLNLIKKLMQPDAIPFARHAATLEQLLTVFEDDVVVQRLLKAGRHNHEGRERVDEEGFMMGECTKMQALLKVEGVERVDEIWPWAGKGPETMTYLPAQDGGGAVTHCVLVEVWRLPASNTLYGCMLPLTRDGHTIEWVIGTLRERTRAAAPWLE